MFEVGKKYKYKYSHTIWKCIHTFTSDTNTYFVLRRDGDVPVLVLENLFQHYEEYKEPKIHKVIAVFYEHDGVHSVIFKGTKIPEFFTHKILKTQIIEYEEK